MTFGRNGTDVVVGVLELVFMGESRAVSLYLGGVLGRVSSDTAMNDKASELHSMAIGISLTTTYDEIRC